MATETRGNATTRKSWESGAKTRSEIDTVELVYQGPYAALAEMQPAKGAVAAPGNDIPAGYAVEQSTLRPKKGGLATLVVVCREITTAASHATPVGALSSTIEVDMAQIEKPLLAHPDYSGYAPQLELWRNSPPELKAVYKYNDGEKEDDGKTLKAKALEGKALDAAKLLLKGVESYLVFAPVVTRTSTYKSMPDPANCGKIDTPPYTPPGAWVYLKTGDRIMQQADTSYTRTEHWTGADEWEETLYAHT